MIASSNGSRRALIVEGGGMRGAFTAGVLDVFHEEGFDPFDLYIGVSAGACNLSSFVAGQHKRNLRLYTGMMCQREFMDAERFIRGGHYVDLDWLWEAFGRYDPLDVSAAVDHLKSKRFVSVCTSVESGEPRYLESNGQNWLLHIKASSAVPILYRGFVDVDGQLCTDGGVTDAIPVGEALRHGTNTIVLVRSRPLSYVKKNGLETMMAALFLRNYPALSKVMFRRPHYYRQAQSLIEYPPSGIKVYQIVPRHTLRSNRVSQDRHKLMADYSHGREQGRDFLVNLPAGLSKG